MSCARKIHKRTVVCISCLPWLPWSPPVRKIFGVAMSKCVCVCVCVCVYVCVYLSVGREHEMPSSGVPDWRRHIRLICAFISAQLPNGGRMLPQHNTVHTHTHTYSWPHHRLRRVNDKVSHTHLPAGILATRALRSCLGWYRFFPGAHAFAAFARVLFRCCWCISPAAHARHQSGIVNLALVVWSGTSDLQFMCAWCVCVRVILFHYHLISESPRGERSKRIPVCGCDARWWAGFPGWKVSECVNKAHWLKQ